MTSGKHTLRRPTACSGEHKYRRSILRHPLPGKRIKALRRLRETAESNRRSTSVIFGSVLHSARRIPFSEGVENAKTETEKRCYLVSQQRDSFI